MLHFLHALYIDDTANKMVKIDRQNFVVDLNLSFSKDIAIKKKRPYNCGKLLKNEEFCRYFLKKGRMALTIDFYYS